MTSSRKPILKNLPVAAKTERKTHNGTCASFEGVLYQSLSSFAKEYGFSGTYKMAWFKQQLSKRQLNNRLLITSVPEDVRQGKAVQQRLDSAERKTNTRCAGLYKTTVLLERKRGKKRTGDVFSVAVVPAAVLHVNYIKTPLKSQSDRVVYD